MPHRFFVNQRRQSSQKTPSNETFRDFMVSGPKEHGVDGLVNLFGIDSPGLTACMALAEQLASSIQGNEIKG